MAVFRDVPVKAVVDPVRGLHAVLVWVLAAGFGCEAQCGDVQHAVVQQFSESRHAEAFDHGQVETADVRSRRVQDVRGGHALDEPEGLFGDDPG